ncbi:MAG: NYN domain-containing protein [Acidobacteriota bacterium]
MAGHGHRDEVLIVDGYNVIFRLSPAALDSAEEMRACRRELEAALAAHGGRVGSRPWVFYDGRAHLQRRAPTGGETLRVSYVDPPAEADDAIVQATAQMAAAGRRVRVVTSDGGLARRVAAAGGSVEPVEQLAAHLAGGVAAPTAPGGSLPASPEDSMEAAFLRIHERLESLQAYVAAGDRPAEDAAGRASAAGTRPAGKDPDEMDPDPRAARREKGRRRQQRRLRRMSGPGARKHRPRRH